MPLSRSKFTSVAERLFFSRYTDDAREITFGSGNFAAAADDLGYAIVDQLSKFYVACGFHKPLPRSIRAAALSDFEWRLFGGADSYRFVLRRDFHVVPDKMLAEYRVNYETASNRQSCGLMRKRELPDVVFTNHLLDNFTGLRCKSREMGVCTDVQLRFGTVEAMQATIDDLVFGES